MPALEIMKNIYWVGAIDWNIREFHGYSTYKGTTYNSFLVVGEKIALFDTVKKPFTRELLNNISEIVDPSRIDYVIVNHAEMDHTGALPEVVDKVNPEKIFCSPLCKKALIDHFHHEEWPYETMRTGNTLNIGSKTVQFIETKMLHWPDSMFSYIKEDKLLISSDAFGQHWATSERFDDEVDSSELHSHAAKYYANILLPFSDLVQKLLKQVGEMGLEIDMIATDHGLLWRSNPGKIISAYDTWSKQVARRKAVIIYDTMWESTGMMARAIADGLIDEGVQVKFMNLRECHRSEVLAEILDAKALIFGSPTLNNGMLPTVADILAYMKGLRPTGKVAAAFGSYGWSGEAAEQIREIVEKGMHMAFVDPLIKIRYVPRKSDLSECRALGKECANAIKESELTASLS
jgi:flavorubredoxin